MRLFSFFAVLCFSSNLTAQWNLISSPTKADLKSVHVIDKAVWISGEDGIVLHSVDNGTSFEICSVPSDAQHASLRSIQGIDSNTAVVMSSGKGTHSALYRTVDGCKSWKQVFVNPDENASFDSLRRMTGKQMYLLSDPVDGKFVLYFSQDGGSEWFISDDPGLQAAPGETAERSTLSSSGPFLYFGTSAADMPRVHYTSPQCTSSDSTICPVAWSKADLSIGSVPNSGIRAVVVRVQTSMNGKMGTSFAAVGGSSKDSHIPVAATSGEGSQWVAAVTPTAGERTAAMIDQATQTMVAVGPTGTDISKDYGKHWAPPKEGPGPGWNALSLPFAVGNDGRIGVLALQSLKP